MNHVLNYNFIQKSQHNEGEKLHLNERKMANNNLKRLPQITLYKNTGRGQRRRRRRYNLTHYIII